MPERTPAKAIAAMPAVWSKLSPNARRALVTAWHSEGVGYSSWRQLIELSAPKTSALLDEYGLSRRPPRPPKNVA
jgi:hypothetical protein